MGSRPARRRYCRCGTHLATDNTAGQCAQCERVSRGKLICPPEVPAEFWQTGQFQDAFAAQHMGRVARAYRTHPHHHAVYGPGGISQTLLGEWMGLRQPHVSRIENGPPIRDLDTLAYWARVLRIPPNLLWFDLPGSKRHPTTSTSKMGPDREQHSRSKYTLDSASRSDSTQSDLVHEQLLVLRRVLDAHDLPDDGPVRSLNQLDQLVCAIVGMRLNSEYARLVSELPELLAELNRALDLHHGQRRAVVARLLVQAYRAADAIADKFGYFDLSARIIALMQSTALASGDELVIAAASYVRAETFFASGDFEAGRRMLELAADRLMPEFSTDTAAAYGALHMRAAVTAARAGHAARAHEHLDEAGSIACRVPEGIYHGTAFGSASVRIHRVTLAVDLADVDAALRFGDGWVPPPAIPAERRSHYFVDLGRAHLQAAQYDHAIGALRAAREIAPQHIRVHPDVRSVLSALRDADVTEIDEFVKWVGEPEILD